MIVCAVGTGTGSETTVTWNDLATSAAAPYVESPACEAVTVHVPVETSERLEPETVHTLAVELA